MEVQVKALRPEPPFAHSVNDPGKVRSIVNSGALSSAGWVESRGRELLPLYRLDLLGDNGLQATYWLGTNAYPGLFPCYSLCTGWWVASSRADGTLDDSRHKGLTSSTYFYFLADLGIQ